MILTQEAIGGVQSLSPKKLSTSPTTWFTSNEKSVCSISPSSSASWEQVSILNEVESDAELSSYWADSRFILLSGKRKCGKDYFANILRNDIQERFRQTAAIIHISEPIKRAFAEEHHLDLKQLMSSSGYKEAFRRHMVRWGELERRKDSTIFCRKALEYLMQDSVFKPAFVIVADCRRPSDIGFFFGLNKEVPPLHLRILASPAVRRARGWIFSSGIDDAETECALDDVHFDILVVNESERTLNLSMAIVRRALSGSPLRKLMTI